MTRSECRSTARSIALAGLVEELKACRPTDHYLNGVWFNNIHRQILWHRYSKRLKPNTHIKVPSWSWASLDGWVKFLVDQFLGSKSVEAGIQLRSQQELQIRGSLLPFVYAPRFSDNSPHYETARGLMKTASLDKNSLKGAICPCPENGVENALLARVSEEVKRTFDKISYLAELFPDRDLIIDTSQCPRGLCALDQYGVEMSRIGRVLYCAPIIQGLGFDDHRDNNVYCYSLVLERLSQDADERGMHTYVRKGVAILHAHEDWTGSLSEQVEYLLV